MYFQWPILLSSENINLIRYERNFQLNILHQGFQRATYQFGQSLAFITILYDVADL